jgi:tetratricopeptide (TPR) repeat protein
MKRAVLVFLLLSSAATLTASGQEGRRAARIVEPPPVCASAPIKVPEPSPAARREMEAKLAEARARYVRQPADADAVIWLGRRTAYLGRFDEAIGIYTKGIASHPRDARLYRHRGHRYLTVRCFDRAVKDLERAARLIKGKPDEVEPDGQPNAQNVPTSTTNSNIYYHLGLAHYLRGDFKRALAAYRKCMEFSKNPDMLTATAHWLYMTLRRLDRRAEAEHILALIRADMAVIENRDYHRLLLMYKGELTPEKLYAEATKAGGSLGFASTAYGVGNWHLYNGQPDKALKVFLKILDGPQTTSFGYIAAEAELARLGIKGYPRGTLPLKTID